MTKLIFVWVLFAPGLDQTHVFDTYKACEAFRQDQIETYGMNLSRCHKEVYMGRKPYPRREP
jgi:hypothetical protein